MMRLVIASLLSEIRRAAELVDQFRAQHGLSDDDANAVHVVLDEVLSNSIRHGLAGAATHAITLTLQLSGDEIVIEVEDDGVAYDPTQAAPPVLEGTLEERKTGGLGVERAVDCSANENARATAIRATRKWGRIVFLGEGGRVEFNPSPDIIHDQKTIYGSWVTSTWLMDELVERLVRWNLHPADLVTHRFPLDKVDQAYTLMASGKCGKVAVCFDEEL